MPESSTHRRYKKEVAGSRGKTKKRIKRTKKRLDASNSIKDSEIEIGGTSVGLTLVIKKLRKSRKLKRVLLVPQKDLQKAEEIAKKLRTKITIRNLTGTKYREIK